MDEEGLEPTKDTEDVGKAVINDNAMDWSDCYGLAWDLETMGNYNAADLSASCLHGDNNMRSSFGETCAVNLHGSGLDSESGYCDSLSTSTDKELSQFFRIADGEDALEDQADYLAGEDSLEDMPLYVDIEEAEKRGFYCPSKQGGLANDVNGSNSQIVSAKGTVRGVKNRVRSNVKRFLEHKSSCIKEEEQAVTSDVVVYTTSLRSIRRTFDDCSHVKKILQNNRIKTDERDIFLNNHYRSELLQRLNGKPMPIPVVFVKGELLGGKEQVEKLNESGALKDLANSLERLTSSATCGRCGGFRFVNCPRCSGSGRSRRMRMSREINSLRCTSCKKGLSPCPECNSCSVKATTTEIGEF